MSAQFLSKTEVAEFTRAKTRAKQRRVLVANGIRHYLDGDGWPIVTRVAIETLVGTAHDSSPVWKPNKAA